MEVTLRPELRQRLDDRVHSGQFPSVDVLIEQALERFLAEEDQGDEEVDELTDEDLAALVEANREIESGEFIEFDEFNAQMRKKFNLK